MYDHISDISCMHAGAYVCSCKPRQRQDFYGRPMECGKPLYFCSVVSFFFLSFFFFFSLPNLSACTWCGSSENLECTSEMCCTLLAANAEPKNSPSAHHRTTLSCCIFAKIDNRKKLVKQQYLHHMS